VRHFVWLVAAMAVAAGCGSSADPAPPKAAPSATAPVAPSAPAAAPAAKPDAGNKAANPGGAPLLLAESSGQTDLPDGPDGIRRPPRRTRGKEADNSRCHVCHVNFSEERLAVGHAWANVGCEKCHGPSDAHCGDEGNVTPPTTLYARSDIDKSCKVCHPTDRLVEGAKSCFEVPDESKGQHYCTDCHGKHQMARRTVRWDAVTRKLLPKDATRG